MPCTPPGILVSVVGSAYSDDLVMVWSFSHCGTWRSSMFSIPESRQDFIKYITVELALVYNVFPCRGSHLRSILQRLQIELCNNSASGSLGTDYFGKRKVARMAYPYAYS